MTFWPRSWRRDFSEYAPASPWKDTRMGFVPAADVEDGLLVGEMAPPLGLNAVF